MASSLLTLKNISKSFPGVRALNQVNLDFKAGEVHALCGENGAGKSTLMNIISGSLQPDRGDILWRGKEIQLNDVHHAQDLGISIVHQERSLVDQMNIAENIFANRQSTNAWGGIDYSGLYERAQEMLHLVRMNDISPKKIVADLSPAQQQMVEIAKAIAHEPELLILDEPTASITDEETETLFSIIKQLTDTGVCVVYISHRMAEIMKVSTQVSVLKDGVYQGTFQTVHTTQDEIIRQMIGRDLMQEKYHSQRGKDKILEVKGLSGEGFEEVTFDIKEGEVLGLAGLVGAGRTEVALTLFGDEPMKSGVVQLCGKVIVPKSTSQMMEAGLAYIPEDRKKSGLYLEQSVARNLVDTRPNKGWFKPTNAKKMVLELCVKFGVKTPTIQQKTGNLSGGNQQKIVFAKWFNTNPEVLIADEPTHGVDIGAKTEIYQLIRKHTEQRKCVLLISSELPELRLLCDRIAVMCKGRLVKILSHQEADEETIMKYATATNYMESIR